MGTSAIKTSTAPTGQSLILTAGSNITVTTNGDQLVISTTAAETTTSPQLIDETLSVSL